VVVGMFLLRSVVFQQYEGTKVILNS